MMMKPRNKIASFVMADFKKLRVGKKAHALALNDDRVSAFGSVCELEYHIMVARDVGEMSQDDYTALHGQVVDIKRMLHGLIEKLSEQ